MLRIQHPFLFLPTAEARVALGPRLRDSACRAFREIAMAAKGLEIAHLQFEFEELTLAVCSRVRADGLVEIEAGLGNPKLPRRTFTAAEARRAREEGERRRRQEGPSPRRRAW